MTNHKTKFGILKKISHAECTKAEKLRSHNYEGQKSHKHFYMHILTVTEYYVALF